MKTHRSPRRSRRGFTLLEMTTVILVLLALTKIGFVATSQLSEWRMGRAASETLRTVYSAQRMFLADHPTHLVEDIVDADIIPYLSSSGDPDNPAPMPTVESLTGGTLTIRVDVFEPYADDGSGGRYDPSVITTDSLWDVGE